MSTLAYKQQILLLGTCRILVNDQRSFILGNNYYIQQPVHYSTSITEAINNFDIISKKKSIDEYSNELLFEVFRYTSKGKAYDDINSINLSNCVVVIEICSDKYILTENNTITCQADFRIY